VFPLAFGGVAGSGMFTDEVQCAGNVGLWAAVCVEGRVATRNVGLGAGALSCRGGS
jgi:hypothetical protein